MLALFYCLITFLPSLSVLLFSQVQSIVFQVTSFSSISRGHDFTEALVTAIGFDGFAYPLYPPFQSPLIPAIPSPRNSYIRLLPNLRRCFPPGRWPGLPLEVLYLNRSEIEGLREEELHDHGKFSGVEGVSSLSNRKEGRKWRENTNQKAPEDFPDWKCSKKLQRKKPITTIQIHYIAEIIEMKI